MIPPKLEGKYRITLTVKFIFIEGTAFGFALPFLLVLIAATY